MKARRLLLMLGLLMALSTCVASIQPEDTILIADTPREVAAAVSTGAEVVYGGGMVGEEIGSDRRVFEIGYEETPYPAVKRENLPQLMNLSETGRCPADRVKKLYVGMIVSLNDSRTACTADEGASSVSVSTLQERYIERVKETGSAVNHILVSTRRMALSAAAIAARQRAVLKIVDVPSGRDSGNITATAFNFTTASRFPQESALFNTTVEEDALQLEKSGVLGTFEDGVIEGWAHREGGAGEMGAAPRDSHWGSYAAEFNKTDGTRIVGYTNLSNPTHLHFAVMHAEHSDGHAAVRLENSSLRIGAGKVFKFSFVQACSSVPGMAVYHGGGCDPIKPDASQGYFRGEFFIVHLRNIDYQERDFDLTVRKASSEDIIYEQHSLQFRDDVSKAHRFVLRDDAGTSPTHSFIDQRGVAPPSGNVTGAVRLIGGEWKRFAGLQIDVLEIEANATIWAVLEAKNETNATVATEVLRIEEDGKQNMTADIGRFQDLKISFNMTGGKIDGVTVFHSPLTGREEIWRGGNSSQTVRHAIRDAVDVLSTQGMYTAGRAQYTDGLYISLLGVPAIERPDPVEAGDWSIADSKDGKTFTTDLPYGDLNGDGMIDAAVGRYPADNAVASRMYLRSKHYEGKEALVASEYLHQNWPVVLAYLGGGMFSGKSVEDILEGQGYTVSRAVEYRANPEQFLLDVTPLALADVLDESRRIEERVGNVLGESVGTAVSQVFLAVKTLEYVERTLEQYLEFDWSTAGLDVRRAMSRLSLEEREGLRQMPERVAGSVDGGGGTVSGGVVDTLRKDRVQMALPKAVYAFFWPDRYGRLSAERLRRSARGSEVVYYTGVGNTSVWVLPNEFDTVAGMVKTGRYNGSRQFGVDAVPRNQAKLVFDNSNLAAQRNAPLREAFLRNGAAAYIGATTVNYAPFSSEIDSRFFRRGYTVGQSLKKAINEFAADSITWDPVNVVARNNVKGKMLRSFRLYGNPEMRKDPAVTEDPFEREVDCDARQCTLSLKADINYSIQETGGKRSIQVDSGQALLKSFRPIIPLLSAERTLPSAARIIDYNVSRRSRLVENITVPDVIPISHGGRVIRRNNTGRFPKESYRISSSETVDGRVRVSFVTAAFQYWPNRQEALISETVEVSVRYRTPYELSLTASDTNTNRTRVTAHVSNMEEETTAEILVQVSGETREGRKTVQKLISPGGNRIRIPVEVGGEGRYEAKALLFVGDSTVGPRTDTFVVGRPGRDDRVRPPVRVRSRPSTWSGRWKDGLRVSFTPHMHQISMEWDTGELRLKKNQSATDTVMETATFTARERITGGLKEVTVEHPDGRVILTMRGGRRMVEEQGGLSADRAIAVYRRLLNRKSEMVERYRRRRTAIPDRYRVGGW